MAAIPLQNLRDAVRNAQGDQCNECDAPPTSRPSSRLHNFVATDNGIAGLASKRGRETWNHNRSSAFSNTKDSEVVQGLLLPCLTYGKGQFELGQAKKGRTGNREPAKYASCNASCIAYAAASTILPCELTCLLNALLQLLTTLPRVRRRYPSTPAIQGGPTFLRSPTKMRDGQECVRSQCHHDPQPRRDPTPRTSPSCGDAIPIPAADVNAAVAAASTSWDRYEDQSGQPAQFPFRGGQVQAMDDT